MKEHKDRSGIYQIRNTVNNKVYIGKTKCFHQRYHQYVSDVRKQNTRHVNQHLLNAFNKYGFDVFEFTVLEFCPVENCFDRELVWMVKTNCTDRALGYNLRMDSSTGLITHPDTKKKISENLKKQWADGIRDGHSDKLKLCWEHRSREDQSKLFSESLTKYTYLVTYPDGTVEAMLFKQLKESGMQSVLSSFHRQQKDLVKYKDVQVERVKTK